MRKTKEEKAITLLTLIITVVILLILVAVAISNINNDRVLTHATDIAKMYNNASANEQQTLGKHMDFLANSGNSTQVFYRTEPEFYGTTAINLKVGDKIDLKSSIFRIFAKDFYDGDLSSNIRIIENTINIAKEGIYHIKYLVTNSQGINKEITVPVEINNSKARTVQRMLYKDADSWNTEINGINKGNYHDRQNLGIYLEAGASLKIREKSGVIDKLHGDLFNNASNTEKEFSVTNEWTTITNDYDSVPFIRTYNISPKYTYQMCPTPGYALWGTNYFEQARDNTIYFANIFDKKSQNEAIDTIIVSLYNCDKAEIYINPTGGDINSEGYILLKTIENPSNGNSIIKLMNPITIESDKFIVAVKYTGSHVPFFKSAELNNYTYISSNLSSNWELWERSNSEGNYNIPPIICQSVNESTEQPIIEINIEDIFKSQSLIKTLDYYLYGDNENQFFQTWNNSQNSFSVIESDRITFLVPIKDKNMFLNQSNANYFRNIKEMLKYYDDIFETYDKFIGLEKNTQDKLHRNVVTKFFVKANNSYSNPNALAYYGKNYCAAVGDSIEDYTYKGWLVLHEIGHGYEGDIGDNDINLGEAQNNVFAYYMEKQYLEEGNLGWMGFTPQKEKTWNEIRANIPYGKKFNYLIDEQDYTGTKTDHYHVRLYMMINMLNKIGFQKPMATLYKNSREDHYYGMGATKEADLIAESFSEASECNFIPYLESWHMEITEELKQEIKEKEYPIIYYLRDLVESDTQAEVIKNDLGLEGIYSLVTNKEIEGYNLKGNAQIQLSIENYTKLKGNNVILKSGNQVIKTVEITSQNIKFTNIPIGVYQIELENNNYVLDTGYLIISQNQTTNLISDINIK